MPPIPTKDVVARVRLTERDLKLWHRAAAARGLTLSAWLHGLVTAALSGPSDDSPPSAGGKNAP